MDIASLFRADRPVYSFEIFPPKRGGELGSIQETLRCLTELRPDFISVTFGAGGTGANTTLEVAHTVKREFGIEPLVHLTCQGSSREEIRNRLTEFREAGLLNLLALRGDRDPAQPERGDFTYAAELISFIKEQGDFHISAACYPEGHIEAASPADDIRHLKEKVDAGASHLISQLFFDNAVFYSFLERARSAGICVPVEAGIMPVVNKRQVERMVSLCGASLPAKFRLMLDKYGDHPEALRDAGIAYAVDQIVDLTAHNVDGIHLYTMNNPLIAKKISDSVETVLRVQTPYPVLCGEKEKRGESR